MDPEIQSEDGFAPKFEALWGALGAVVAAYFGSTSLLLAWIALSHETTHAGTLSVGDLVSSSLGTWLGFLGGALLASRIRGTGSIRRDYSFALRPLVDVPVGIVAGLALQVIILPAIYLPLQPLIPDLQKKLSGPANYITSAGHGSSMVVVGLVLVVCAPLVEEVFFRGLLLQSISYRLRNLGHRTNTILTVLLSAIGFGIAHVEPLQLLGLTAVGVVLASLRIRFDRLGPGIVTHATFNFITFASLYHR